MYRTKLDSVRNEYTTHSATSATGASSASASITLLSQSDGNRPADYIYVSKSHIYAHKAPAQPPDVRLIFPAQHCLSPYAWPRATSITLSSSAAVRSCTSIFGFSSPISCLHVTCVSPALEPTLVSCMPVILCLYYPALRPSRLRLRALCVLLASPCGSRAAPTSRPRRSPRLRPHPVLRLFVLAPAYPGFSRRPASSSRTPRAFRVSGPYPHRVLRTLARSCAHPASSRPPVSSPCTPRALPISSICTFAPTSWPCVRLRIPRARYMYGILHVSTRHRMISSLSISRR